MLCPAELSAASWNQNRLQAVFKLYSSKAVPFISRAAIRGIAPLTDIRRLSLQGDTPGRLHPGFSQSLHEVFVLGSLATLATAMCAGGALARKGGQGVARRERRQTQGELLHADAPGLLRTRGKGGPEGRSRTGDACAFNAALYRLSYLGMVC